MAETLLQQGVYITQIDNSPGELISIDFLEQNPAYV
jgi:hypothetical protein